MTARKRQDGIMSGLGLGALALMGSALVVYLAGTIIIPPPPAEGSASGPLAAPTVDTLSGNQAVVVVSGDQQARLTLDHLTIDEYNEGHVETQPLTLSLTYSSGEATLLLNAREITLETPATGQSASAVLGWQGSNYFATSGECTIHLASIDQMVLEPMEAVADGVPRGVPIPTYSGTFECLNVEEVRDGSQVTLTGTFQYQPDQ